MATERNNDGFGIKPINLLWYAIALFLPIIYFVVLTDNTHENNPLAVYAMCIVLYALAGWLSSSRDHRGATGWILWSIVIGIVQASIMYFAV